MNVRQAAQALANSMVTMWRAYKNVDPEVYNDKDKVISMWKCLDREGGPGRIINYNWDGATQQINGLYEGTVKQEKAIVPKG